MSQEWMIRVNEGIALFRARWMVDFEGIASRIQTYVVSRLSIEPLELDAQLAFNRSWRALGLATVSTTAMWSDRFRKIVISQRSLPPVSGGLVVILMPQRGLDLPCFYAELSVSATALTAVVDLLSPFFSEPGYRTQVQRYLEEPHQAHRHLNATTPPEWMAELRSGLGLSIQLPCEDVEQAAAALFEYLDRYLDMVLEAPFAGASMSDELESRSDDVVIAFSRCLERHMPARPVLERLFGQSWTRRYGEFIHSA